MICVVFWCNSDRGYFNDPHHCIKLYLYTLNHSTYFFGRKGRLHAWLLEWMQNDSKLPSNYQKGKGTFYYYCCCCCWYYYYNYYFCAPVTSHSNYIGFCFFLTRSINQTINQWLYDTSNVIVNYWLRCGLCGTPTVSGLSIPLWSVARCRYDQALGSFCQHTSKTACQ